MFQHIFVLDSGITYLGRREIDHFQLLHREQFMTLSISGPLATGGLYHHCRSAAMKSAFHVSKRHGEKGHG